MSARKALIALIGLTLVSLACGYKPSGVQSANSPQSATTDPHTTVAIVQVRPPEELREFLFELAKTENIKENFREAFMEYYTTGGHGSGFSVIGGSEGHTRLITNRHVAQGSDYVDVSFDGKKTTIRGDIAYIDSDYDVAVIDLPVKRPGLQFKSSVAELEDVIAVGYPALGGKGSYQITPGKVSNPCLEGDLVDGNTGCWIQHTASIDPGSSGGPLLTPDMRVVGMNTAYFKRRQNVFVSVPAATIQKVIDRAEDVRVNRGDKGWMTSHLQQTCFALMRELSADEADGPKLVTQFSYKLAVRKGLSALRDVDNPMLARVLQDVMEEDPLEAINVAILYQVHENIEELGGLAKDETCSHLHPSDDVLGGGDIRVSIEMRQGHMDLGWRFERGAWRLSKY